MTKPVELEEGDSVRIVGNTYEGDESPYHYMKVGSVGEVTDVYDDGCLEVYGPGHNGHNIHQEICRSELRKLPKKVK